jgi:16S rRNA (guanine527-N7)-methyltransferase
VTSATQRLLDGAAEILGRPLSDTEHGQLAKYLNLLIKWHKTQRLVGSSEPAWIVDNVILDSLLFTRLLPAGVREVIDVGSGAGVPGIPLKVVSNSLSMTLLEARQKRASFLATAVRELGLVNCSVANERLEQLPSMTGGRFDAAVARCAGDPVDLLRGVQPLMKAGGLVIASGPPERRPVNQGAWQEVVWSGGRRLFWTHSIT